MREIDRGMRRCRSRHIASSLASSMASYATVIERDAREKEEGEEGEDVDITARVFDGDDDGRARRCGGGDDGVPRVAELVRGKIRVFRRAALGGGDGGDASPARSNEVCVLGVPSAIGVADFCRFAAAAMERAKRVRVVSSSSDVVAASAAANVADVADDGGRRNSRMTYDVVLTFVDCDAAGVFVSNYNGRRYSSASPEACVALYVDSVEYDVDAIDRDNATEIPSCPVCLDRLDEDVSGIVTTICNHSFHADCLSGWADASCPVCRYSHSPEPNVVCGKCGKDHDLWVCLICGEVACGRYAGACAVDHWRSTNHCYSLEVGTQRVWDYVSDGFVHRLIQSKSGLVELSPRADRRNSAASAAESDGSCCSNHRRELDVSDLDPALEEALVSSKLDAIASEYDLLLTSQLESQRKYFEALLQAANDGREGVISQQDEENRNAAVLSRAMSEAKEAKRALKVAQKTNNAHEKTIAELRNELEHMRVLSDGLSDNVKAVRHELERVQKRRDIELALKDARIKELEDETRDLMLFLDTQAKLETNEALAEEIAGGTVVGVNADSPNAHDDKPSRDSTHARLQAKLKTRSPR
jgi:BRCA1-associated protein